MENTTLSNTCNTTNLVLVLERFDVAHELLEGVLLPVEDEVLGELAVQLLHLLGHRLQNITLRPRLLAERPHLLKEPEIISQLITVINKH